MKRSEIINQLLNEGFTSKTLMNFSDKQLLSLSSRINESLTVSQKTLDTDPNTKMKVNNMAKDTDVKIVPEGGVPGLKAKKVVKETGVPGLTAKKSSGELKNGTAEKEMKESGVPGLKAKVVKKEVKEAAGAMPGLTIGGKSNVSKSSNPVKEKEVDENDDNDADDNESNDKKDGKVSKKQAFLDMIKKKKENKSINEWVDDVAQKHYRPFTTKNDIMEMIMTKLDEVELGLDNNSKYFNWLDKNFEIRKDEQGNYSSFRKNGDPYHIFNIATKLSEKTNMDELDAFDILHQWTQIKQSELGNNNTGQGIEMDENKVETKKLPEFLKYKAIKGSGAAPAPAEPKTRPGTKTPPKQNPNERPKTPYKPGPGINPAPKAKMGVNVAPKTMPKA
jgi:hypothetical protein